MRVPWQAVLLLLATFGLGGCATSQVQKATVDPPIAFVPDVSDEEWQAAMPMKGSSIEMPRLLRGEARLDAEGLLALNETAVTTISMVIRADGSVGLYRVVKSTNPKVTDRVIRMLRGQRYEPPLLNGQPVAARGDVSEELTRVH